MEKIKNWILNIDYMKIVGIILKVLLIFVIGYILIKIVLKAVAKILTSLGLDKVAHKFIMSAIKTALIVLLFMCIAEVLGVSMTGFVAIFTALSLAISLSLQGSLSNLANGIVIIGTKPFLEGDYVKIGDIDGSVEEIKMMHTILKSIDNKKISIPNSTVVNSNIINYNTNSTRKVIQTYNFEYGVNVDKVQEVIRQVIKSCGLILDTPSPFVTLDELNLDGVQVYLSVTVDTANYWDAYYYLVDNIFNELKRNNIKFATNNINIHINSTEDSIYVRSTQLASRTNQLTKPTLKIKKGNIVDNIFGTVTGAKIFGKLIDKQKNHNKKK